MSIDDSTVSINTNKKTLYFDLHSVGTLRNFRSSWYEIFLCSSSLWRSLIFFFFSPFVLLSSRGIRMLKF